MLTKRQLVEELRHAENEIQRLEAGLQAKSFAVVRQRDKAALATIKAEDAATVARVWRERARQAEKSLNDMRAVAQSNASRVDTAMQLVHEARALIRGMGDPL